MKEKIVLIMSISLTIFVFMSFFFDVSDEIKSRFTNSFIGLLTLAFGYIFGNKKGGK